MKTLLQFTIGCLSFCLSSSEIYAIDTLSSQTNEYLVQKIDSFQVDKNNQEVWKFINAYILKAKVRKDVETLFYGYKEGIYFANDYDTKLKFADSAIFIAQKTKSNDLIVQSFLSKGLIHYQYKKFQPALQNYLLAERKLSDKTSDYLANKVTFNLALIKFHLKQFDEANSLFRKCSIYFDKNSSDVNHQIYYLNTLYYQASIHQSLQEYKTANQLNLYGLKLSQELQNSYFIHYFTTSIAIDDYFKKEYYKTIKILSKEVKFLSEQQDFNSLTKVYFYIGKSYEKLNQKEKSIEYFEKIDQLFNQNDYLDHEFRSVYEYLIGYYGKKNDHEKQLYYINQLLTLDQLTHENFVKLSPVMLKEYDVKELLKLKKEVEFKTRIYPIVLVVTIFGSLIGFFWIYIRFLKNKSIRKKKLNDLPQEITDIPSEIVLEIIIKLDEFEDKLLFLQPTVTLTQLAKSFKTNTAYLSRIINIQKKTNFSHYLNQLRVHYVINLLTIDDQYHKHSVKDLAELGGFSSYRHFSNAFFQVTSLRPYAFIKQLKHKIKLEELKKKNES